MNNEQWLLTRKHCKQVVIGEVCVRGGIKCVHILPNFFIENMWSHNVNLTCGMLAHTNFDDRIYIRCGSELYITLDIKWMPVRNSGPAVTAIDPLCCRARRASAQSWQLPYRAIDIVWAISGTEKWLSIHQHDNGFLRSPNELANGLLQ